MRRRSLKRKTKKIRSIKNKGDRIISGARKMWGHLKFEMGKIAVLKRKILWNPKTKLVKKEVWGSYFRILSVSICQLWSKESSISKLCWMKISQISLIKLYWLWALWWKFYSWRVSYRESNKFMRLKKLSMAISVWSYFFVSRKCTKLRDLWSKYWGKFSKGMNCRNNRTLTLRISKL